MGIFPHQLPYHFMPMRQLVPLQRSTSWARLKDCTVSNHENQTNHRHCLYCVTSCGNNVFPSSPSASRNMPSPINTRSGRAWEQCVLGSAPARWWCAMGTWLNIQVEVCGHDLFMVPPCPMARNLHMSNHHGMLILSLWWHSEQCLQCGKRI